MQPEESNRNDAIRALERRLESATDPIEQLLATARMCGWNESEPFRSWPSRIGASASSTLPGALCERCLDLIRRLRRESGSALADAVVESQDVLSLLRSDRLHGRLLEDVHDALESVVHECTSVLLDDEAASVLEEFNRSQHLDLLPPEWVLGIIRHPLGETPRLELARVAAEWTPPVRPVCAVPSFEGELVFDGGRPSPRMMSTFGRRQGMILCGDGSKAMVRAILEPDWRISVEFDAEHDWCGRIDGVRLGALSAAALDEDQDTWIASLSDFGLDTQTRLVGQPIMVTLSSGERFSM